jgi:hypothetical protein
MRTAPGKTLCASTGANGKTHPDGSRFRVTRLVLSLPPPPSTVAPESQPPEQHHHAKGDCRNGEYSGPRNGVHLDHHSIWRWLRLVVLRNGTAFISPDIYEIPMVHDGNKHLYPPGCCKARRVHETRLTGSSVVIQDALPTPRKFARIPPPLVYGRVQRPKPLPADHARHGHLCRIVDQSRDRQPPRTTKICPPSQRPSLCQSNSRCYVALGSDNGGCCDAKDDCVLRACGAADVRCASSSYVNLGLCI